MMKPFKTITSTVIPLPLKDIDTDMIIPAAYLTSIRRHGYGHALFRRLREANPDFPFNLKKFAGAQILVTGPNFGCGSSREHAVWALLDYGIKVIIAPSFADIFKSNSAKNGLVLVQLPEPIVNKFMKNAASGHHELTVNLEQQTVTTPDQKILNFPFDPFRKQCILKGLDDFGYLQRHQKDIDQYDKKHQQNLFYSTLKANYW